LANGDAVPASMNPEGGQGDGKVRDRELTAKWNKNWVSLNTEGLYTRRKRGWAKGETERVNPSAENLSLQHGRGNA